MAELGCTEYEIMAVQGHSDTKPSKVYTEKAERWRMAVTAMSRFRSLEW